MRERRFSILLPTVMIPWKCVRQRRTRSRRCQANLTISIKGRDGPKNDFKGAKLFRCSFSTPKQCGSTGSLRDWHVVNESRHCHYICTPLDASARSISPTVSSTPSAGGEKNRHLGECWIYSQGQGGLTRRLISVASIKNCKARCPSS